MRIASHDQCVYRLVLRVAVRARIKTSLPSSPLRLYLLSYGDHYVPRIYQHDTTKPGRTFSVDLFDCQTRQMKPTQVFLHFIYPLIYTVFPSVCYKLVTALNHDVYESLLFCSSSKNTNLCFCVKVIYKYRLF